MQQWAVGGLFFLWITTRRREVGIGYGWLLRATFAIFAIGSLVLGVAFDFVAGREIGSAMVVAATLVAMLGGKQLAGTGVLYDNDYAATYIGPDGTFYVGVNGGIVAMKDGPSK